MLVARFIFEAIILGLFAHRSRAADAEDTSRASTASNWRTSGGEEEDEMVVTDGPAAISSVAETYGLHPELHAELHAAAQAAAEALHNVQAVNAESAKVISTPAKVGAATTSSSKASGGARGHLVVSDSASLAEENEAAVHKLSLQTRHHRWSPTGGFLFVSTDEWVQWPGLRKTIQLTVPAVIFVSYATAVESAHSHIFSRLEVDGVERPMARSICGSTKLCSTVGFWIDLMDKGDHEFRVLYRSKIAGVFPEGGTDIYQRSLNIMALPEATFLSRSPNWDFRFSSSNLYWPYDGFEDTIDVIYETPALLFYSCSLVTRNSMLATKLFIDNLEQKSTRSVWGSETFGQLTGFLVDYIKPGRRKFELKYRTPSRAMYYSNNEDADVQTRTMSLVWLPESDIYNLHDETEYQLTNGDVWTQWPGLEKTFTTYTDRYVIATYSVAMQVGQSSSIGVVPAHIHSKMWVDDIEQPSTRHVCGEIVFCTNIGMFTGVLAAGTHTIRVMYRTNVNVTIPSGLYNDYVNRAMNIVVLKRTSEVPPSLLEQTGGVAGSGIGKHIEKLRAIELGLRGEAIEQPTTQPTLEERQV